MAQATTMRVLRLYLMNAGVFKQHVIEFTDEQGNPQDMICLSGVNGSGKTTIMETIFYLASFLRLESDTPNVDHSRPHVFTYVEFAQLDIAIDRKIISIVLGDREHRQKVQGIEQMFIYVPQASKEGIRRFESILKVESRDDDDTNPLRKNFKLLKDAVELMSEEPEIEDIDSFTDFLQTIKKYENTDLLKEKLDLPAVVYFSTGSRAIHDIRLDQLPRYVVNYEFAHRYHPRSDDPNKILVYLDFAYPERFQELKDWINQHVLLDKEIKGTNRPDFKVVVKTKSHDEHGLELLSSGEENLLILAFQLHLRANSKTIFLIDEIDQSLHPEYKERIMRIIKQIQKESGCQIILSSHSPTIWNAFGDDREIIRLTGVLTGE